MRDSLILMASSELETLRTTNPQKWTVETELQFLGAKLFLFGWSLRGTAEEVDLGLLAPTAGSEPLLSKKLILHEALGAATHYIHAFSELKGSKPSSRSTPDLTRQQSYPSEEIPPQLYFPKYYFWTLYFAALTLYHFLAILPQSSISDLDLARNHVRLAHTIFTRCTLPQGDSRNEWARLAQNIELVGQWTNSSRRLPPEAQIKSRQGAGLFYDAMLKLGVMKGERGGRSWGSDLEGGPPDDVLPLKEEVPQPPEMLDLTGSHVNGGTVPEQQFVPQEWDDAFWGWDLTMIDSADLQLDWNGLDQWQPEWRP